MSRRLKLLGKGGDDKTPETFAVARNTQGGRTFSAAGKQPAVTEEEKPTSIHKLIRAPRTQGKKLNVMKFREGSEVTLHKLVEPVTLIQDDADDDERLEETYALKGKGAEFGKAQKEAARRKKYRPRRNKRKAAPPYQLKDSDRIHLTGELQENLKGKYYLIEALEGGVFQIRPVDNYWEFRKYRTNRNVTLEVAEAEMARKAPRTDRFFKKDLNPESEVAMRKRGNGLKLRVGEDEGPSEFDETSSSTEKKKPKAKKIMSTRKTEADAEPDDEDVDNVDEDYFAPDSDEEIGGVTGTTSGGVFKHEGDGLVDVGAEVESSEDEEEFEAVANVIRQKDEEEVDEVLDLDEDEEEEDDEEEEEDSKVDLDEKLLWGVRTTEAGKDVGKDAVNSGTANDGSSAGSNGGSNDDSASNSNIGNVRKRAEAENESPQQKKRKTDGTPDAQIASTTSTTTPSASNVAPRPIGILVSNHSLAKEIKEMLRSDIDKYLIREGSHGMTSKELMKKLKKQPYFKGKGKDQSDNIRKEIVDILPKVSKQKKVEGQDRLVHKTMLKKK